ncbi:MAG: hypothetical protein HC798_03740, partial [Polaribacter sp.]|nr:hypothetical protein [Polaribacter sp.]
MSIYLEPRGLALDETARIYSNSLVVSKACQVIASSAMKFGWRIDMEDGESEDAERYDDAQKFFQGLKFKMALHDGIIDLMHSGNMPLEIGRALN